MQNLFLKEILNFISSFSVILQLSISARLPAVSWVCLFLPISSASLFEMFCSGIPADFRKRHKLRKARVKKNCEFPGSVLSQMSFGRLSSSVDRAVFSSFVTGKVWLEAELEKMYLMVVPPVACGLLRSMEQFCLLQNSLDH